MPELTLPHAMLVMAILFAVISQLLFKTGVGSIGQVTLTGTTLIE